MSLSAPIDLVISEGVAWLTLNRPDDTNAINLEMAHGLARCVRQIRESAAQVVVISGSGGNFSSGGDVLEMAAAEVLRDYVAELAGTFHEALIALSDLPAVVIAAVDGVAAGAGLGLALAADVRIASDRASFATAFDGLGFTPDSGTTFLLPRVIGMARALAMSSTGARLDAPTAGEVGLVAEVVCVDDVTARTRALALQLVERPQGHMAATRRLYRGSDPDAYRCHLEAEARAITAAAATDDARSRVDDLASRLRRAAEARRRRDSRPAA